MVPEQNSLDPDRLKKLELGDPDFFGRYASSNNSFSNRRASTTSVKLKSAAVQLPNSNGSTTSDIQKQRDLPGL
jgi:hypothetical protein